MEPLSLLRHIKGTCYVQLIKLLIGEGNLWHTYAHTIATLRHLGCPSYFSCGSCTLPVYNYVASKFRRQPHTLQSAQAHFCVPPHNIVMLMHVVIPAASNLRSIVVKPRYKEDVLTAENFVQLKILIRAFKVSAVNKISPIPRTLLVYSILSLRTHKQIARRSGYNSAVTSIGACGTDRTESNASV